MALVPLEIGKKPYYNVDPVSKGLNISDSCIDGYIDETGTVRRRGGIEEAINLDTGKPGLGIFYWPQADCMIARSGTQCFKIAQDMTVTEITGVAFNEQTTSFADGNKIDGSQWLYLFDGGYPVYTTDAATLTRLDASTGSPANVNFGCWNTGRYLVAQNNTRKFYATDTDPTSTVIENDYFLASNNPLTAERRPDNLDYIGSHFDEIVVMGKQGIEYWSADDTFFSIISGAITPVGIAAPYSVVECNNSIHALCYVDSGKKIAVCKIINRNPTVISSSIDLPLKSYSRIDDAIAWATNNNEYLITFPTEGVTWCYDYKLDTWYQWTKWHVEQASRTEFLGRFGAYAWGSYYMQSRLDGKIYRYSPDIYQDAGETLATEYITGWLGGNNQTRCNRMRFRIKRGQGDLSGSEPKLLVRWRDNGGQVWSKAKEISLGKIGEYDFYKEIRSCGIYTSRQYSFTLHANCELQLVGVEHEIEQMTR